MNTKIAFKVQCFHCGDIVKTNKYTIEEDGITKYFCCNGCLNAYKFINQLNLDLYYKNREDFSEKPDELFDLSLFEFVDNKIPVSYKDNLKFKEKSFHIQGLHCASCVWLNENVLSKLDGVIEVNVNFSNNRIYLKWNPEKISLKEIADNVHKIGYKLQLVEESYENSFKSISESLLKKMAIAGFFTGNNMLISAALYAGYFDVMDPKIKQFFHYFSFLFATPVYFYSASEFFKNAYYSLKNKIISMDILTSVGISLAYFYSIWITFTNQIHREVFFDAICFVVFAILIGRFIESRLKLKTYYFTTNLGSLIPSIVRKLKHHELNNMQNITEENFEYADIEEIQEGDIILTYPNEIIPLDSQLLNDKIEVDEASITGENLPITKQKNDFITSGSKNLSSEILLLKVLKNKENSTISQILTMSEESIKDKSKTENITHKVASIFIVFVLFLGFLTFGYWYFIKNQLSEAIINTLSILIVACPCALSLSVPTAIIVGIQKLFSHGILFKNSSVIETLSKTKILAFDKTGTLTKGNLELEKIYTFIPTQILKNFIHQINEHQREMLLQHPITSAFYKIEQLFEKQNLEYQNHIYNQNFYDFLNSLKIISGKYLPGQGLMFEFNNQQTQENYLFLGSKEFLENQSININEEQLDCSGCIEIYMGIKYNNEIKILAMFVLRDAIREEAHKLFNKINKKYHTILLTGDKKENALWIQNQLKIKEIYYELKPEEKAKIIKQFQTHNTIIMIGDGINDSIALKQANVGLSFAEASKLALYSSDILLLNYDLELIDYILKYSRAILRKIKQNLVLSFFYNVLLLPLAFLGMLNPFVGSIFMSLSSVTVVSNSLTLLKYRDETKK